MTLLAKARLGVIISSLLVFWACENTDDLGLELDPGDSETQVLFEELALTTNSVFIDSLRTDGGSGLIIGSNQDSVVGQVSVTAYTQIEYRNGTVPVDTLRLESGKLYLEVVDILSSNAFVDQEFEIRMTAEPVFQSAVYFADQSLATGDTVLATWPVIVSDFEQPIVVDLEFAFADRLWVELLESSNVSEWNLGIEIAAAQPDGGIVNVNIDGDSTFIALESLDSRDSDFNTFFDFTNQFHNVTRDRSGSLISDVNETGDVTSFNDISLVNALAGVYTTIDLGPLRDFAINNPDAVVNNAEIEIPSSEDLINERSTRVGIMNFLFAADGSVINGPGLLSDLGVTALAPEDDYLGASIPQAARSVSLDVDNLDYNQQITLFSQFFLSMQTIDEETLTTGFVLIPALRLTTQQSAIVSDSVKMKLFYTVLSQ